MKSEGLKFLLLGAILSCSCSKGVEMDQTVPSSPYEVGHEMIELGEKMEDPYSLVNVTKALKSLYPTKAVSLEATDRYVRFLPKNEAEYDKLCDMGVILIDHPLDYRIIKDGDYYHDPSIKDNAITWQYAVVRPGFEFPGGIKYEVLDECYIPENDENTKADDIDWQAVESEAYRITGNADLLETGTKGNTVNSGPSGYIQIVDDAYEGDKPIGVKGVKISVNSFVKFASAYTDENGYYQIDRHYSSNIRYRMVFQNVKGFAIGFNLLLIPASISALGSDSPEGVSIVIDKNSDRKQFTRSVVNNAAYDYYTMTEETDVSVRTPPSNLRFWLFQNLGIGCSPMFQQGAIIDTDLVSTVLGMYKEILKVFMPDVLLGLDGCDDYASVYAAALHQLAHASHYMQVGNIFWNDLIVYNLKAFIKAGFVAYGSGTDENAGLCEVGEMWAYFIQNSLYRERYGKDAQAFGGSYWFHPQILMYLSERGVTRGKIFRALTSDVVSRETLWTKLSSLYPENRSIIDQAFERYPN